MAAEGEKVWTVIKVVDCGTFGRVLTFDAEAEAVLPGGFALLRPETVPKDSQREQGFSFVSAPGEPAAVGVGTRRWLPAEFEAAMRVGGRFVLASTQVNSGIMQRQDIRPNLVYACGRCPLATIPLASIVRWRPGTGQLAPRLWWCIHTEEEVEGFAEAVAAGGPALAAVPDAGGRSAVQAVVLRCGAVAEGAAVDAAVGALQEALGRGAVREERCGAEGIAALPRLLAAARDADAAAGLGTGVETLGSSLLHRQLRMRLPTCHFAHQESFGFRPDPACEEPLPSAWPVACIMPFRALLPWRCPERPCAFQEWLFLPTDPLPVAMFRIAFGFLCCTYAIKALWSGRVYRDHVWSHMRFKYDHLEFLGTDIPAPYVYWVYVIMGLSAAGLCIGWPYRLSCLAFTVTFGWHFFSEATSYNNHYWLMTLLGLHFLLADAAGSFALDPPGMLRCWWGSRRAPVAPPHSAAEPARDADGTPVAMGAAADRSGELRRRKAPPAPPPSAQPQQPGRRVRPVPYLYHFMFRHLVLFVFFMGGIAKLNCDWVSGHTLRAGLIGEAPWLLVEICVFFLGWGGLLLDLVGPLYLLHGLTRPLGLLLYSFFNVSNMFLWSIGVFPYMMIGALPLLCESWTPRAAILSMANSAVAWRQEQAGSAAAPQEGARRCGRLRGALGRWAREAAGRLGAWVLAELPPYVDSTRQMHDLAAWRTRPDGALPPPPPSPMPGWSARRRCLTALLVVLIAALHIAIPLRHYAYHRGTTQWVAWTERGRKFSWHMMSRHKDCAGTIAVTHAATGTSLHYNIASEPPTHDGPMAVNDHQMKKLPTIATYVRQYCWKLRGVFEDWVAAHYGAAMIDRAADEAAIADPAKAVRIHANVTCRLNGGADQPFISPLWDLSRAVPPPEWDPEPWVLPQTDFGTGGYPSLGAEWFASGGP
eukprot:TRINITY_DN33687_c1_g3_i2.p1 TRINITY_DN33687_c1_g3~~TRINITY_DN33687_c1_g3_i2.p1  ORF type:complete len:930 (+),score=275.73 TRINITY_DN33687_c1_g3_i2:64-2853(+)